MNKKADPLHIPFYDMAAEASAALRGQIDREIPGVKEEISETPFCRTTKITICNEEGAALMGRPCGTYITLDVKESANIAEVEKDIVQNLSELLTAILPQEKDKPMLICGIGNPDIASDALGEKTVSRIFPTRHLFRSGDLDPAEGYTSAAMFCPNVLGNTGMEAAELIEGVCRRIKPRGIIVIDALATSSPQRLAAGFQLTDTGLTPGGGVGNTRPAINEETMGVPVIALGVPTVIYPQALIGEAVATLKDFFAEHEKAAAPQSWNTAEEFLFQKMEHRFTLGAVTPKDIDTTTDQLSRIMAGAIQTALHPAVTAENYEEYFHL